MTKDEILKDFELVKAKAAEKWGWFRRLISKRPLTGFWAGVGLGGVAMWVVRFLP